MILSFDVWNTLLAANPEFKAQRLHAICNAIGLPEDQVSVKFDETKRALDFIQENTGKAFTSLFCWQLLLKNLGIKDDIKFIAPVLLGISNMLFKQYPPEFNVELIKKLRKVKDDTRRPCDLVLVSNTNFVPGYVVWETCFNHLDLFEKAYFSDESGYAKPSREAFAEGWPYVSERKIIHIGDNVKTDGVCRLYGADYVYVTDPKDTLRVLTEVY